MPDETHAPQDPKPVSESPDTATPPLAAKWPWWVSAGLALVAILGFIVVIIYGWGFVVRSNETVEREDFEQLLGLMDRVQTVVMFLLGAVFGVSVAAGGVAAASSAAQKNKSEAEKQNADAKENHQAATLNKKIVEKARGDINFASGIMKSVQELGESRAQDDTRFVEPGTVRHASLSQEGFHIENGGELELAVAPRLPSVDQALLLLSRQCADVQQRLAKWDDVD